MQNTKYHLIAAVLLITVFLYPCDAATPKLHERVSGKALKILNNPKYVTLLILSQEEGEAGETPIHEIHLNNIEIERLKRNLLDDHNYDFTQTRHPPFRPEISFKFEDGQEQVLHLFVGSHCHQMLFYLPSLSAFVNYTPAQERLEHFFQELTAEVMVRNRYSG
ncbi:MAG: hypothetical protein WB791_09510 [Waddliaceae bacterium]